MAGQKQGKRLRKRWIVGPLVGLLLVAVLLISQLRDISNLTSHPNPVKSYDEALQRIADLKTKQIVELHPECNLRLLTHGQKVDKVIIFVHGYTNCPKQFLELGERFYQLGYNVLIAPLPYSGEVNTMTEAHAQLSAEALVRYTDEVVDIAQGLGSKVDIAGISAGGIIAAYAGQYRRDVNLAISMAPAFGINQIPAPLTVSAINIASILPNVFIWWDPIHKQVGGIDHAYPRFSTHALVQTMRLGLAVQAGAQRQAPAAKILMITNPKDPAVNKDLIAAIVKNWESHGAAITSYEFPASLNLKHDFIEIEDSSLPVDKIYPKLIELMTE